MEQTCAGDACRKRKYEYAVLAALALVLLLSRLSFVHEPFERDEGFYATIGQIILHGGIPYRDAIDIKPPGIFYLYAIIIPLVGGSVVGIRIFTAVYSLATLASVWWGARRVAGSAAGLCAAAIFAFFSSAPLVQGSSSNTEVFMLLPLTLAACFLVAWMDGSRRGFLAAAGAASAVALLIKTVALPYVGVLFVFAVAGGKRSTRRRLLDASTFVLPLLVAGGGTILYFYLHGALGDFIACNITIPMMYAKGGGVSGRPFAAIIRLLGPELLLPALLAFPSAVWLLGTRRDRSGLLFPCLLVASCIGVWMPGKFFPHYFIQLFPVLAVVGGIGAAEAWRRRGAVRWLMLAAVAVSFSWYAAKDYRFYFLLTPEQVSTVKYGPTFSQSLYVARYVKERTTPRDYIFQWGFEPEIYFLADRRPPVPHISSTSPGNMPDPQAAIAGMLEGLEASRPAYVVVQPLWGGTPGGDEVAELLTRAYTLETEIGYALIFRRNDYTPQGM